MEDAGLKSHLATLFADVMSISDVTFIYQNNCLTKIFNIV